MKKRAVVQGRLFALVRAYAAKTHHTSRGLSDYQLTCQYTSTNTCTLATDTTLRCYLVIRSTCFTCLATWSCFGKLKGLIACHILAHSIAWQLSFISSFKKRVACLAHPIEHTHIFSMIAHAKHIIRPHHHRHHHPSAYVGTCVHNSVATPLTLSWRRESQPITIMQLRCVKTR